MAAAGSKQRKCHTIYFINPKGIKFKLRKDLKQKHHKHTRAKGHFLLVNTNLKYNKIIQQMTKKNQSKGPSQ
jgi:hypothetical protein